MRHERVGIVVEREYNRQSFDSLDILVKCRYSGSLYTANSTEIGLVSPSFGTDDFPLVHS